MNITILSVDVKTVPTAKGSYQVADIAYKNNTFQGKVEGKKVMSFGATAGAFKVLAEATSGDTFNVTVVKNDKGYNDWTALTRGDASAAASSPPSSTAGATKASTTPTRTTYETPEERAQRQVLIVRQSSVSSALGILSAGTKAPLKIEDVLATAHIIEQYVFNGSLEPNVSSSDFPEIE